MIEPNWDLVLLNLVDGPARPLVSPRTNKSAPLAPDLDRNIQGLGHTANHLDSNISARHVRQHPLLKIIIRHLPGAAITDWHETAMRMPLRKHCCKPATIRPVRRSDYPRTVVTFGLSRWLFPVRYHSVWADFWASIRL